MPDVSLVITTLTVAAALALVVERVLEVVKHFRDEDNAKVEKDQVSKSASFSVKQAKELIGQLKTVLQAYEQAKDLDALRQSELKAKAGAAPPPAIKQMADDINEPDDKEFEQHSSVVVRGGDGYHPSGNL